MLKERGPLVDSMLMYTVAIQLIDGHHMGKPFNLKQFWACFKICH